MSKRLLIGMVLSLGVAIGAIVTLIPSAQAQTCSMNTFPNGGTISSTKLNSNFTTLANNAVGCGALVSDAQIDPAAAMAHTKLKTPALVPKAWAYVANPCSSSPCTVGDGSQVTSIIRNSTGTYSVTLSYTPANTAWGTIVTANAGGNLCIPGTFQVTPPHFQIFCADVSGSSSTLIDSGFSFIVMDT